MPETLSGYDEIPYESFPITETHPDRLAVIGRLFGLPCRDPARGRVLELGCASGGNLLPIAWNLPNTRCVGLELSRVQAERGAILADSLGLSNVEIRHQDLQSFEPEGEPFDYIIAHGLFSWVPPEVQEHILRVCGSRLAPGGIAYISYNTLPGGRQRSMLRDMLLHHARGYTYPTERLAAAREMIDFLSTPLESEPPGHDWLRSELNRLRDARDSYLYHEYLEDTNDPLLFTDFVARAGAHGLQYLADAQLHTLFPSTLGAAAESSLARFGELIEEEQYADFLRLRPFRQSLLCRGADRLTREIDLDGLLSLPLYSDLAPDAEGRYQSATGQHFHLDGHLLRAVVARLAQAFPTARMLADVLQEVSEERAARKVSVGSAEDSALPQQLFSLLVSGGVHATLCAPTPGRDMRSAPGTGPRASGLARGLAAQGEHRIPTVRHQTLQLDPPSARLLSMLDGDRNHREIVEAMLSVAARERNLFPLPGAGSPSASRENIEQRLVELLDLLDRHGLLESR